MFLQKSLLRRDGDVDSIAKMKAAEESLEAKEKDKVTSVFQATDHTLVIYSWSVKTWGFLQSFRIHILKQF